MKLEEMGRFFNRRVEGYEDHMKHNVDGGDEIYTETAKLIPNTENMALLDLGCGTGLELDEILKKNKTVHVTGIDLAKGMINKLKNKYSNCESSIELICANYFNYEFKEDFYDVALSVQSLHHFTYEEKVMLYKKVYKSLKENGIYIEADYMAPNQAYEDYYFLENKRIREELGIKSGYYHYDTPCTVENQIKMMKAAGFRSVDIKWSCGNTVILLVHK